MLDSRQLGPAPFPRPPTKLCRACNVEKDESEFYRRVASRDGLQSSCKPCERARRVMFNTRSPGVQAERQRAYYWKNHEEVKRRMRAYHRSDPLRYSAHGAVSRAIKTGLLTRRSCEICGSPRTDAHHDSYAQEDWLVVRWLCRSHHIAHHRKGNQ